MAEIRKAVKSDTAQLISLGVEFATKSQPIHGFSVSEESISVFARQIIKSPDAVVFVLADGDKLQGVIAGVIQPIFFSKEFALQELVWYVKPNTSGLKLLYEFETEARRRGVFTIVVGSKPGYCDMSKFYTRRGYTMLEHQFIKRL